MVSLIKYFKIDKKQALKAIKTVVFVFALGLEKGEPSERRGKLHG